MTLPWTLSNLSTGIFSKGIEQDTLFQKWSHQCQVLMWFSLPITSSQSSFCCFHADGLNLGTGLGVAMGFTFSWLSSRLPAALLSTLFSHIDASTLRSTLALYSLMYNFMYLLAANLPRNWHAQYQWAVPFVSYHLPGLCYLPVVPVIFFFFW